MTNIARHYRKKKKFANDVYFDFIDFMHSSLCFQSELNQTYTTFWLTWLGHNRKQSARERVLEDCPTTFDYSYWDTNYKIRIDDIYEDFWVVSFCKKESQESIVYIIMKKEI